MLIRRFEVRDAPSVCEIFYRSIHEVACAKYDEAQVHAWTPAVPDPAKWLARLTAYDTFVADNDDGKTVGWIAMSGNGYIDMHFCLPEATRCGVAAELYSAVERAAIGSSYRAPFVELLSFTVGSSRVRCGRPAAR